jgi:hypothetical protein
MKRSGIKRGEPLRRSGIRSKGDGKARKPISKQSKKAKDEKKEAEAFRIATLDNSAWCERCGAWATEAHHICLRSRARGHKDKHNAEKNGSALCSECHNSIHFSAPEDAGDWIKPRRWLDAGGRLGEENRA